MEGKKKQVVPLSKSEWRRCYAEIIVCGIINNFGFCIVSAAAQNLAKDIFDTPDLMTTFTLMLQVACTLSTVANAKFLMRYSFGFRVLGLVVFAALAYGVLAVSTLSENTTGFMIASLSTLVLGAVQSIGECTNLAFLQQFPPELIGAWGLGTGLSGLVAPGLYMGMHSANIPHWLIFSSLIPTSVIYRLIFRRLDSAARAGAERQATNDDTTPLLANNSNETNNASFSIDSVRTTLSHSGLIVFCMTSVYFFEYSILPGFVDRATMRLEGHEYSYLQKNVFVLSYMAYNLGVTVSRFSVTVYQIERVWILSVIQFLNCSLWAVESVLHLLRDLGDLGYGLMLVWLVWVGCMGGATYSNCMAQMNFHPDIPDKYRELGVNVAFLLGNIGIMSSMIMFLALDQTVLSEQNLYG